MLRSCGVLPGITSIQRGSDSSQNVAIEVCSEEGIAWHHSLQHARTAAC